VCGGGYLSYDKRDRFGVIKGGFGGLVDGLTVESQLLKIVSGLKMKLFINEF
jgi:hypothetical protein